MSYSTTNWRTAVLSRPSLPTGTSATRLRPFVAFKRICSRPFLTGQRA